MQLTRGAWRMNLVSQLLGNFFPFILTWVSVSYWIKQLPSSIKWARSSSVIGGNIGADFHTAMVATAPGEKLLTGRRLVRNWARRTTSSVFLCRKLHLFLGKSTETAATRAALFHSNMHQIVCRLRLHLRRHWGAYSALPGPTSCIKGGYL